jgi:hypothetical protein
MSYAIASSKGLIPEMENAARLTLDYPMTFESMGDETGPVQRLGTARPCPLPQALPGQPGPSASSRSWIIATAHRRSGRFASTQSILNHLQLA